MGKRTDPPRLHTVVTVAMRLDVYETKSLVEHRLIQFLAATDRGDWTVGGRFPSIEEGLARHVHSPLRSVEWALSQLRKAGVIKITKRKYETTYSLSAEFRQRCIQVYEAYDWRRPDWGLLEDVLSQQRTATHCGPGPQPIAVASRDTEEKTPNGVFSFQERRTAEAGRPDGRPKEDTMSDTPNDGFYGTPKKPDKWGAKSEGVPLGGEQPKVAPMAPRKSSPPRTKEVLVIMGYFEAKLLAFSEVRNVPLWGVIGKAKRNIDLLVKQGHSQDILERAIDFFASQTDSMMFMGESLWDLFFARRDEAIKFATISAIGSHGGPQESLADKGRRLASRKEQS